MTLAQQLQHELAILAAKVKRQAEARENDEAWQRQSAAGFADALEALRYVAICLDRTQTAGG